MRVRSILLFCFLSIFGLLLVLFPQPRGARETSKGKISKRALPHLTGFTEPEVVSKTFLTQITKDGALSRQLEPQASAAFRVDKGRTSLHAITGTSTTSLAQQAEPRPLMLTLQATPQLEEFPQAKAALQRAAARWSAMVLGKPEPAIPSFELRMSVDFGPTAFGFPFNSPTTLGVTNASAVRLRATSSRSEQFQSWSSTLQQVSVFSFLPYPWKTDLAETEFVEFPESIIKMVGFVLSVPLDQSTMAFNSAVKFDFDPSDGIDADKIDFEAAAMREIGRCLGFISNVGERELEPKLRPGPFQPNPSTPTLLDLHRYRSGVNMDLLRTAAKSQLSGGEQVFFTGDVDAQLSTGRPDGTGGDGRPAGHWKDDALTGRYLGIMDPTLEPGERGGVTALDLAAMGYIFYRANPETTVMEALSLDDNTREDALPFNGALVVNRVTPTRAPFKLQAVRVHLPQPAGGGSPAGQPLRVVAFADPDRTGVAPSNPTLLVDRTVTIAAVPENRWIEVMIPNGPALNGGDLYIGVQSSGGNVLLAGDDDAPQSRSFISTDNGANFQPLRAPDQAPLNFMARAVVTTNFNADTNLLPELRALSPGVAAPGGADFTMYVFGNNFFPESTDSEGFSYNSVVLWNGTARETTYLSKSLLRARIRAADIAQAGMARVQVVTTGREMNSTTGPIEFRIGPEGTTPMIEQLDPPLGAAGGGPLTLSIFGRNFRSNSVARWNGKDRPTTLVNSTELKATIPASDLAGLVSTEITVFNPIGGESNPLNFRTASCTYSLAPALLNVRQDLISTYSHAGTLLVTQDHCPWTARSNSPWLNNFYMPTNGKGNMPIGFQVQNNSTNTQRIGTITVGGQTLTVSQPGALASVSAASYSTMSTAEAIVSSFGVGLAKTTLAATTKPLPMTLGGASVIVTDVGGYEYPAPLFFVSPTQINFQMPDEVTLPPATTTTIGSALVSVYVENLLVAENNIRLGAVAPALFTANATGQGVAVGLALRVRANGSQEYEPLAVFDPVRNMVVARPIDLGPEGERVFLVLFGTGIRKRSSARAVSVKVGDLDAPVPFAGAQGDLVGVDQVNVELPRALRGRGEVALSLIVDKFSANLVTVTIQ